MALVSLVPNSDGFVVHALVRFPPAGGEGEGGGGMGVRLGVGYSSRDLESGLGVRDRGVWVELHWNRNCHCLLKSCMSISYSNGTLK